MIRMRIAFAIVFAAVPPLIQAASDVTGINVVAQKGVSTLFAVKTDSHLPARVKRVLTPLIRILPLFPRTGNFI